MTPKQPYYPDISDAELNKILDSDMKRSYPYMLSVIVFMGLCIFNIYKGWSDTNLWYIFGGLLVVMLYIRKYQQINNPRTEREKEIGRRVVIQVLVIAILYLIYELVSKFLFGK